jgi:hypothetical protein
MAWNSAATSVTITPTGGLAYATGSSPGTAAKSYTIKVGTAARDPAGNPMIAAFTSSFTTLKRITWVVTPSLLYQTDTSTDPRSACSSTLKIGGWSAMYSGGDLFSYITFDLSGAGSPSAMYSIESATLYATQIADSGNFYSKPAHVEVWRLGYDGSMNLSVFPVLSDVGTLASSATPAVSLDTLSSFKNDFVSNGVTQLLFKVAPIASAAWVSEQEANFNCDYFHLDMIYLMP